MKYISFCQNRIPVKKVMSKNFLWEHFSPISDIHFLGSPLSSANLFLAAEHLIQTSANESVHVIQYIQAHPLWKHL